MRSLGAHRLMREADVGTKRALPGRRGLTLTGPLGRASWRRQGLSGETKAWQPEGEDGAEAVGPHAERPGAQGKRQAGGHKSHPGYGRV